MENLLLQLQTSVRGLWIARVCSTVSSHLTASDHYHASLCLVRHVTIKLLICLSLTACQVANVSIQVSAPFTIFRLLNERILQSYEYFITLRQEVTLPLQSRHTRL